MGKRVRILHQKDKVDGVITLFYGLAKHKKFNTLEFSLCGIVVYRINMGPQVATDFYDKSYKTHGASDAAARRALHFCYAEALTIFTCLGARDITEASRTHAIKLSIRYVHST